MASTVRFCGRYWMVTGSSLSPAHFGSFNQKMCLGNYPAERSTLKLLTVEL